MNADDAVRKFLHKLEELNSKGIVKPVRKQDLGLALASPHACGGRRWSLFATTSPN